MLAVGCLCGVELVRGEEPNAFQMCFSMEGILFFELEGVGFNRILPLVFYREGRREAGQDLTGHSPTLFQPLSGSDFRFSVLS